MKMRTLTLDQLVQQVYYTQEKVILDFHFYDDKYREVIMELNLVLQELQKEEDWLWLRERLVLGPCADFTGDHGIPEFRLPSWVYKPSGLHDDGVRLYKRKHLGHGLQENNYIFCPWSSAGEINRPQMDWYTLWGGVNMPDVHLEAVNFSGLVTFNRKLGPEERTRIAVTDVQREIQLIDIPPRYDEYQNADQDQKDKWDEYYTKREWFSEIPDPNYLVFRVAALHCVGSPVAQMRMQDLTDSAQKLLSAMREANAMSTRPSRVKYARPGYINVV